MQQNAAMQHVDFCRILSFDMSHFVTDVAFCRGPLEEGPLDVIISENECISIG